MSSKQCSTCQGESGEDMKDLLSLVTTFDAVHVAQLTARAPAGALTQLHTAGNGLIVSNGRSLANGTGCTVDFEGAIGPIPYKGSITINVDLQARKIRVHLHLDLPFPFDHDWVFNMNGATELANGGLAVSSLSLDLDSAVAASTTRGLNWWCVLKCGGLAILGILLKCLPSLTGGVPAYVACVTGQAGAGAASIAICIAQKCA